MPAGRHPRRRTATGLFTVIAQRGWSLSEAARQLGVHHTTLIGMRDGHHGPGLRTMEAVEAALPNYTRAWLFPVADTNGGPHGA